MLVWPLLPFAMDAWGLPSLRGILGSEANEFDTSPHLLSFPHALPLDGFLFLLTVKHFFVGWLNFSLPIH